MGDSFFQKLTRWAFAVRPRDEVCLAGKPYALDNKHMTIIASGLSKVNLCVDEHGS